MLIGAILCVGFVAWSFIEFMASALNSSFYTLTLVIGGISIWTLCLAISYTVARPALYMLSPNKPEGNDAPHTPIIEKTGLRNAADYNQRAVEPDN